MDLGVEYKPADLLSSETLDQWRNPPLTGEDLMAACIAGPPPEFVAPTFPEGDDDDLSVEPEFRAAELAGYWAARLVLGRATEGAPAAQEDDAWVERSVETVAAMDVIGLAWWSDELEAASDVVLDRILEEHQIDPSDDDAVGFVHFAYDQALAYALVDHDLAQSRLPPSPDRSDDI